MALTQNRMRRKPGWYLIAAVAVAVIAYCTFHTGHSVLYLMRLMKLKAREEKELERAIEKRDRLMRERTRLMSDSTYIEEIARREYGMIRKGEEVYRVTLPDSSGKADTDGGH